MVMLKRILGLKEINILKHILILFTFWRLTITFIAFLALSYLPTRFSDSEVMWANFNSDFWIRWANWDGGHFRGIAERGYLPIQTPFLPLYPLLIKGFMFLGFNSLWAGLIISNLALIGALFFLYKLVRLDMDENSARTSLIVLLAFPTAFYLGAVYSESLFLFLIITSFYFARRGRWFYAFLLGGLSCITRITGVAVLAAILLEFFLNKPDLTVIKLTSQKIQDWLNMKKIISLPILYFLIALLPLLGYCLYLYFTQNNAFAFISYQQAWHRYFTYPWIAPLVFFKDLYHAGFLRIGYSAQQLVEFLFFLLFLGLLIVSLFRLRISYTVFFAISFYFAITSGILLSMPRLGITIFPIMILLAQIRNQTISQYWIFLSLMLQGLFLTVFFNGYWFS